MRIAVAMSGGVDSSLTAVLLKQQGHEVIGLTAQIPFYEKMDIQESGLKLCCSPSSIEDAKSIAHQFGFEHFLINAENDFEKEIIDPFCDEYLRGRTPSPCLHCNKKIKFTNLLVHAKKLGCEKLATGHYARLGFENGRYFIMAARDAAKDQSYFLSMLSQEMLAAICFPLGNFTKEEVRMISKKLHLPVAHKTESQEICFIRDGDYARFIEQRKKIIPREGNIVNEKGEVLGKHSGYYRYTIGQRRGLGIAHHHPLYVIAIRPETNEVVVGHRLSLARRGLYATNINYMKSTQLEGRVFIKIRSTQQAVPGEVHEADGGIHVLFDEPVESITPGQAVVFYDESNAILAAAWIEKAM